MVRPRWLRLSRTRHKVTPTDCQKNPAVNEIVILPQDQECSFSDLPQQLLEAILIKLQSDQCAPRNSKDMFSAIGVCKTWRAAGHAVFFKDSWSGCQTLCGPMIQHPAQLITLCPLQQSNGGHIKCYVQRELLSSSFGSKTYRFVLSQGIDYAQGNGKFLLAAVQDGKHSYALYLNRSCSGTPIAELAANTMQTSYVLTTPAATASSRSSSSATTGRSSNSDKESKREQASAGNQQQQQLQHQHSWPSAAAAAFLHRPQQQQHGCCGCMLCGGTAAAAAGTAASATMRHELARVTYKLRVRGIMLPRRMGVAIPAPQQQQEQQQQQQQQISKPSRARACFNISAAAAAAAADHANTTSVAADAEVQGDIQHHRDQDIPLATAQAPGAAAAAAPAPAPAGDGDGSLRVRSSSSGGECGLLQCAHSTAARSSSRVSEIICRSSSSSSSDGQILLGAPWRQQQQQEVPASPSFKAALQLQLQQQQSQQQQHLPLHCLHNKAPHWNEGLRCWCLNFRGRVRLASVKNFQLVTHPKPDAVSNNFSDMSVHGSAVSIGSNGSGSSEGLSRTSMASSSSSSIDSSTAAVVSAAGRPDSQAGCTITPPPQLVIQGSTNTGGIVTQFGKVDTNVYILDYDPVLMNGLQAFAVALTSFGTKVLL